MRHNIITGIALGLTFTAIGFSCSKSSDDNAETERYLYVASGQCNSGNAITTFSSTNSSRMVSKIGLSSKSSSIVLDLAAEYQGGFFNQETGAQSLIDDGDSLLLLAENSVGTGTGDRKIYSIPKSSPYNTAYYSQDPNAFTNVAGHVMRSMALDADDTILFSKSVAIEKIGTNVVRIPSSQGGGPVAWIDNPQGVGAICANSDTNVTAIVIMPPFTGTTNGKVIYAHQGAADNQNRLGIISHLGYSVNANCLDGQTVSSAVHSIDTGLAASPAPAFDAAGASPTAMVYVPTPSDPLIAGKLLVAYSAAANVINNNTTLNYAIVMYDITETSDTVATISNTATVLYRDSSIIFGISAMAFDSTDNSLYVATSSQPGVMDQTTQAYGYKIEKFTLNLNNAGVSPQLTLVRDTSVTPSKPFIDRSSLTKCITSMTVGN